MADIDKLIAQYGGNIVPEQKAEPSDELAKLAAQFGGTVLSPDVPTTPGGYGAGTFAKDIGKLTAAGAVPGILGAPEAIESAAVQQSKSTFAAPSEILSYLSSPDKLANKFVTSLGFKPIFGKESKGLVPEDLLKKQELLLDEVRAKGKSQNLKDLSAYGQKLGQDIKETASPEIQLAMANFVPTGSLSDIANGRIENLSFGAKPTALGLAGQFANIFGSIAPGMLGTLVTKDPRYMQAFGFGQAGSEGVNNAREYIQSLDDTQLAANSPYFKDLLKAGYDPKTARLMTEEKAVDTSATAQAIVGAVGGNFTAKLITGQFDKALLSSVKNRALNIVARTGKGAVIGGVEEGLQEVAEGIASDLGIDKTVVKEIGSDAFANFVLGAIGGGGVGGVKGALTKGTPTTPQPTPDLTGTGVPPVTPPVDVTGTGVPPAVPPTAPAATVEEDELAPSSIVPPSVVAPVAAMVSTVGLDPVTAQKVESLKAELQMIESRKSDPTRLLNEGELEFYAEREAELAREITALISPAAPAAPAAPVAPVETPVAQEQDLLGKLQEFGEVIESRQDAESRFSNGEQIYAFPEQDEQPFLLRNIDEISAYPPDRLLALPAAAAEEVVTEPKVTETPNVLKHDGIEYADTPRIKNLIEKAEGIQSNLPPVEEGMVRLYRGNREGEVGQNPSFTNSLVGIALPFQESYGGSLSYVDIPKADLAKYESTVGGAPGAEFSLPAELAQQAKEIKSKPTEVTKEEQIAINKARQEEQRAAAEAEKKAKEEEKIKPTGGPAIGGPATPTGGPSTPKKVAPTEEEKKAKEEEKKAKEEEKKAADEEKAKKEEQKKKLAEFNTNPMKVAMETGNADAVAEILYGKAVDENLLPVIFPEEMLLRIPVESSLVGQIEDQLVKNKFRITDRAVPATTDDPSYVGPPRITISALYNPEKVSVQGGGAEFFNNRKGQITAAPLPKDATEKQKDALVTELLDLASPKKLLDIQSNPNNTFGAMMFKEGLVSKIKSPGDYLFDLINLSERAGGQFNTYIPSKAGHRQAIKLVINEGKEGLVRKLLVDYVTSLQTLQTVLNEHSSVTPLYDALMAKYIKDPNADRVPDIFTPEGLGLRVQIDSNIRLNQYLPKLWSLFNVDENSTDQTNRIVKKDAETPPELGNIIRRGMRDHRQGRDVDVQDFLQTFKFLPGGIDFGNWVNQSERTAHLNAIYDAMYDLSDIAGIAPEMLGLNEKLKLAVGAQGRGGKTAAHFVPGANEINLTKTKGDGSLGHEWQHALDWNLRLVPNGRVLMSDTASTLQQTINVERVESNLRSILTNTANSENNRNTPPKKAFFEAISNSRYGQADIYRSSYTDTQYYKDALQLDRGREKPYWSTGVELLSRSFESLIFDLSKGGSPYLVGPTVADGYISKKNGFPGTAYPAGKERPKINEIYQQMIDQIDPETLQIKTYKLENQIIEVEELGYVVVDQYYIDRGRLGGLNWFKTKEEAKQAKEQLDGQEEILTPRLMQISKVNQSIINMAQRIDAIMEEMGLFKWPEIKNGSMAESMFFHMRQGWWPKNNRELAEYGIKAYLQSPELLGFNPAKNQREIDNYKIADFEGDRVKLKQTQEDFEAAAVRYISQVITDMRAEGSDTKAIYDHIVGLYETQPSLDVKSVLSVSNNAYSTPLPIAYLAGMLSRVKSTTTVLDPTGGNGMLVVTANPKNVTTIEIDQHRANNLKLMQMGDVIEGDVLAKIKDIQAQKVDVVLANPPFGSLSSPVDVKSWTGQNYKIGTTDQLIAAESLRTMANDGRAVLLLESHTKPNTITSTDRVFLNWLYSNYNVADHYELAGNLYRKQGASFPLRVLVIAGRNQTDNVYPNDFVVNRLTSFDELWSRYVQTSDRSEQVVVGTRKQRPTTGGADRPSGTVSTGDNLQDGEPSGGVGGTGTGAGIGKPLSPTGGVNVPSKPRGPGTIGEVRDTEQQQDSGDGQRGGPRGGESSTATGSGVLREESGDELGGLSDLDLDEIFDSLGKKPKAGTTTEKAPKGAGGPRAPRTAVPKTKTVIPKELEGLGLEDLLDELDAALNGKTPKVTITEPTPENSDARLDKQAQEAMGRIAQNAKNTSNDPDSGLYSRKDSEEYANVKPIIQKVWEAVGQKVKDTKQRIQMVYDLLFKKFGDLIKSFLRTYVNEIRGIEQRRPKNQTPIQGEPIDTESRVVYLGKSRFASDGIYLPRAQSQHAYTALENLEAQVGNIDEFVTTELGYSSVEQMAKGLAGYQIDALGLAIQANKLGKGFIIGDDTGVGKGRTAAAMIVWAKKQGKIPIFVSLNDSLYTDMYRDLTNIGHGNIKIGMTNAGKKIIKDIGEGRTETVFQNRPGDDTKLTKYITQNKKLPPDIDVLFTNYSQLSGGPGSPARQEAVATLVASGDAVLIMDEAHNAAGTATDKDTMGQNAFFMSLLTGKNLLGKDVDAPEDWKPPPTVYLSATFAKRPDNMPLYIHTNLRYAADTPEELTALFSQGVKTDVLQQVSSEMLVESGSMIRRERSYEGVKMDFVIDDKNTARDTREVDKVTEILRSLVNADRALKEWIKTEAGMDAVIKLGSPLAGKNAFKKVQATPFTGVVHNYIQTLLLSTKTQTAVDMVVDKLNNNEKVVVGLQSTLGSALEDFVEQNNIKKGDEIPDFGWQTLIKRAVSSTKKVTLKSAVDKEFDEVVFIPDDLMPPYIRAGYDNVNKALENFQSDLPPSPIDFIRTELEQKYVWTVNGKVQVGDTPPEGVKARHLVVKEITGRKDGIDYSGDIPKYVTLDNPSRTSMISSYQNGEESKAGPIDVLVINSAGATGISLHASVDAFDQRPRHMIVLQPHGDISVFIQLLGRIHRTGQVEWPSFTMLATGIPAERRILAMLRKKLSSLKSNTSGGSSSTKVEGVDFINMYGDVSTAEYLNEHPDIQAFLNTTEYSDPDDAAGSDLAHKASGTAGLLSSVDQKEFFDSIEASYIAAIDLRNSTGTNALERRVLPLEAEIIKENLIEEGLDSSNPFLTDVAMAQFNVDIIGSIPTVQNIKDDISLALNGRTAQDVVNEIETELNSVYIEVRNQIVLKQQKIDEDIKNPTATEKDIAEFNKTKTALDNQFSTLNERKDKTLLALSDTFAIGNGFDSFIVNSVPSSAVVIGIKVDKTRIGKSKTGNPYSPSNFQIIIKRNIPEGRISVPLSTLEGTSIERSNPSRNPPLEDWFALKSVTGGRTTRYIALGNILRAAQLFGPSGGEIAKFTLKNTKEAISGVVMPAKYVPVAISEQTVRLRNPESTVQYLLAVWDSILQKKYVDTQLETYKDLSNSLQSLMIPNLPKVSENINNVLLRGVKQAWQLRSDTYQPNKFKVTMAGDVSKKIAESPTIKSLIPGEFKKSKGKYEMENGVSLTDPQKIIALVKYLHKNFPATVDADNATFAREVMKVEFDYSESKKGLASRGPAEGGQTVKAVEEQVVPIKGITVKVLQSVDELPDNTAPADVEGMWLSGRTVYLIADNLPNAKRVQEVLAHEAVGHALLEEMLGPKLMAELVRNVQNLEKTSKLVKEIAAKVDRTQPGLSPERRAKEIVANMAERGMSKIGLVQRVIQAIRNWLRNQGYTISFSDLDIIELLNFAENYFDRKETSRFPSLRPAPTKTQAKTQADINRERQQQRREKAAGYFSRDAEGSNTEDFDKQFEEDGFNNAPIRPSSTVKDTLLGGAKQAKQAYENTRDEPAMAYKAMSGKLLRAITYVRNKNIWFGAGLEMAEKINQKAAGLAGKLRDGEGRAMASIAITNALHAGNIAVDVIRQGSLAFNRDSQMFQAIKRPFSMANVVIEKSKLIARVGEQRANDMIQMYFEAKRSKSINDEYQKIEQEIARLDQERLKPGLAPDQLNQVLNDLLDAKQDLKQIGIAKKKVRMSEKQIDFYSKLDEKHPELGSMMENWTRVNQNMIDMMLFSKIISKKRAERLKGIKDYVPWYRIQDDMEDIHDTSTMGGVRSNTNIAKEKKFKDTEVNKDIDDIVDNMLHNVMTITRNSMRNHAANRVVDSFGTRVKGKIAVFPREGSTKNGAVRLNILRNGRRIIVEIKDPLIAEAVTGMEDVAIPGMDILGMAANGLRRGITLWPEFQVKQLFMDAPTAALVSGVKNPTKLWGEVFVGFAKAVKGGDPIVELLQSYGIGGYQSYTRTPEMELKQKIGLLEKGKFDWLMSKLDQIGDASDMAQRVAIYKRVLLETTTAKDGAFPNGDQMQALVAANNIIDFKKRGSGRLAQVLTRTVSFMNAYAQQIDVLAMTLAGSGYTGKDKAAALAQLGKTAALFSLYVILYSLAVGGEDDYEELDDQTKVRNIYIPKSLTQYIGMDNGLLIPMHTSASFFIKSIPELTVNKIRKEGTENEMDNTRLRHALAEAAIDSLLGPNPVPTGAKPIIEIGLNRSFFTGRAITPKSLEGIDAAEQYLATTSELGKVLSALTGNPFNEKRVLNPIEADHLVRSLFGTTGAAVQWGTNILSGDRPTPRDKDNPFYGSFISADVGRAPEDLFYSFKDKVDSRYNTYQSLLKDAKFEEADKYFDRYEKEISAHTYISAMDNSLAEINREIRALGRTSRDMTPDERRAEITDKQRLKNQILEDVIAMRKEAGL
jgi:hypothetical protein